MRRRKEQFMYVCLLLASLWVLVLTNVPHHHHLDGSLCIEKCESFPAGARAHTHGCDTKTGNHPQMIVNERYDEWKIKADISDKEEFPHADRDNFSFLAIEVDQLIQAASLPKFHFLLFNTSFHSVWITNAIGLRAPPFEFDF